MVAPTLRGLSMGRRWEWTPCTRVCLQCASDFGVKSREHSCGGADRPSEFPAEGQSPDGTRQLAGSAFISDLSFLDLRV